VRRVGGVNRAAAANKKLASGGVTQVSAPRSHPVEDDWRDVGKSVGSVNDLREASTLAALRVDRATVVARGRRESCVELRQVREDPSGIRPEWNARRRRDRSGQP